MSRRRLVLLLLGVALAALVPTWTGPPRSAGPLGRDDASGGSSPEPMLPADAPAAGPRLASVPPGKRGAGAETPAGGLVIRSITGPDGEAPASCGIVCQHDTPAWVQLLDGWEPADGPFRTAARGIRRLAVVAEDGAHWVSAPLDPDAREEQAFDVHLAPGAVLAGRVLCQDGRTPAEEARVSLAATSPLEDPLYRDHAPEYGEGGRFVLRGLVPGVHRLEAESDVPREGAPAVLDVEAPADDAVIVLGRRRSVSLRIVDETGTLLQFGSAVEGVFGLARGEPGRAPARVIRTMENPVVFSARGEEDDLFPIHAFGDGYLPSRAFRPADDGPLEASVDLVLRPDPGSLRTVLVDLRFRGAPAPTAVYVRRVFGRDQVVVNGEPRQVPDARVALRLPRREPAVLSFEPMTKAGALAQHAPFDPVTNPWAIERRTLEPDDPPRLEVAFELGAGIRIAEHVDGGRGVGATLSRDDRKLRVYFQRQEQDDGALHPVSTPVPPGRWALTFDGQDRPGRIELDLRPGTITVIDPQATRKAR